MPFKNDKQRKAVMAKLNPRPTSRNYSTKGPAYKKQTPDDSVIKDYYSSKKLIEQIDKATSTKEDALKKKLRGISRLYSDKIFSLEKEQRKKANAIRDKLDLLSKEKAAKIEKKSDPLKKYGRTLALLDSQTNEGNTKYTVNPYRNRSLTKLETLRDNRTVKAEAFIAENDKPKNKYSLIVVGRTIFPEPLIKLPRGYGLPVTDWNANIALNIKDAPTDTELRSYFSKNKEKIIDSSLKNHKELEKEYYKTKKEKNTKNWKIELLKNKKDYYETRVSHGIETPEYKKVLKDLKSLQT